MADKLTNRRIPEDEQIRSVLDRLDREEASQQAVNRRADPRRRFRPKPLCAHIIHPAGGAVDTAVAGRELSAGGMSFLYRGFLHTGTSVRLTLRTRLGAVHSVESRTVWCRHIVGPHHLVGVRFCERVDPSLFIEPAAPSPIEPPPAKVGPTRGNVLLIDNQEMDRLLFEHYASTWNLKITAVGDAESALAAVNSSHVDLVVCDLNLPGTRGQELLSRLHEQGPTRPIIALSGEESPDCIRSAESAGARLVVLKPYDPQGLLLSIAGILGL